MIDTTYLQKCIETLEKAFGLMQESDQSGIDYELYRSASVKEFELIMEQTGKLLKKALKPYFHSSIAVDRLYFKDVFREAARRDLISVEISERFLNYRDLRNNSAHEYGENHAEDVILVMHQFIPDVKELESRLNKFSDDTSSKG